MADDTSRETPDGRGGVVLVWLPEDAGASVGQFFGLISRVIRGDVSGAAWAGATAVDIMTTKGDEFDRTQRSGKLLGESTQLTRGSSRIKGTVQPSNRYRLAKEKKKREIPPRELSHTATDYIACSCTVLRTVPPNVSQPGAGGVSSFL